MASYKFVGSGLINKAQIINKGVGGELVGKYLKAPQIKKLLTQQINVTQLIPEGLLTELAKGFARLGTADVSKLPSGVSADKEFTHLAGPGIFKDYQQAVNLIVPTISRFADVHYAYYVALIKAMDDLVHSPGVPAQEKAYKRGADGRIVAVNKDVSFSRAVQFRPQLKGVPSSSVNLTGVWPGLTAFTMREKKRLNSPVFWKHTGQGAQAFRNAANTRLTSLRPKNFITKSNLETRIGGSSLAGQGAGKYYSKVKYQFTLGIPRWNRNMDALVTIPFATGKLASSLTTSGLVSFDRQGREIPGFKTSSLPLAGIDRLLAAEAYRPWLRDLAIQAGQQMQGFITGKQVTPVKAGKAKQTYQRKIETFKKLKAATDRKQKAETEKKIVEFRARITESRRRFVQEQGRQQLPGDVAPKRTSNSTISKRVRKRISREVRINKIYNTLVDKGTKISRAKAARIYAENPSVIETPRHQEGITSATLAGFVTVDRTKRPKK